MSRHNGLAARLYKWLSNSAYATLGAILLTKAAIKLVHRITTHTGKRALTTMVAPQVSSTPELDEAIDGGFAFALEVKNFLASTGPGGKQVTLDGLLHTVTDGKVRQSVQDLIDAIEAITRGGQVDAVAIFKLGVVAILEFVTNLSEAIKDGFDPEDLLAGVTDGKIRESLSKAVEGAGVIPTELTGLDMWKIMGIFQRISMWIPRLVSNPQ